MEISSCGGFRAYMLSALIPSRRSYPAMPLAGQLVHQRSVQSGPLVLGSGPLKFPTPTTDRDRTVSRRSEPSSRASLMGEQPNPWNVLPLQDVMSRHRKYVRINLDFQEYNMCFHKNTPTALLKINIILKSSTKTIRKFGVK